MTNSRQNGTPAIQDTQNSLLHAHDSFTKIKQLVAFGLSLILMLVLSDVRLFITINFELRFPL